MKGQVPYIDILFASLEEALDDLEACITDLHPVGSQDKDPHPYPERQQEYLNDMLTHAKASVALVQLRNLVYGPPKESL